MRTFKIVLRVLLIILGSAMAILALIGLFSTKSINFLIVLAGGIAFVLLGIFYINPNKSAKKERKPELTEAEKELVSLQNKAKSGDSNAQFYLGQIYEKGAYPKEKAVELYKLSSEAGNVEAMTSLAVCYYEGKGTEKNIKQSFELLKAAAEKENVKAMRILGTYYCYDETYKDAKTGMEWLQKAADKGDANALFTIGKIYFNGDGVRKNSRTAMNYFEKAAEKGNAEAMFTIGLCYYEGTRIKGDQFEGEKWFKKAAENGCIKAFPYASNAYISDMRWSIHNHGEKEAIMDYHKRIKSALKWTKAALDYNPNSLEMKRNLSVCEEWERKYQNFLESQKPKPVKQPTPSYTPSSRPKPSYQPRPTQQPAVEKKSDEPTEDRYFEFIEANIDSSAEIRRIECDRYIHYDVKAKIIFKYRNCKGNINVISKYDAKSDTFDDNYNEYDLKSSSLSHYMNDFLAVKDYEWRLSTDGWGERAVERWL